MQHLDEGTIHAWLDGALPTAEAREIEQHVADCTECAAMVAEARGLIAGASRIVSSLDVVRGNVIPKKTTAGAGKSLWHSLHLTPARAALAATVMIAVSTLLTVRHDTSEKMVAPRIVAAPSSPAMDSGPAATPAAAAPTVASFAPAKEGRAPLVKDRQVATNAQRNERAKSGSADLAARRDMADARAKPETDSIRAGAAAKSTVVAAAPPAVPSPLVSVSGAMAANSLDSSAKKPLAKVASLDSLVTTQRQARQRFAPAFAEQRASFASGPACYQFAEPPASGMPRRFALDRVPGDSSQHVVRAVNENGRPDSVLAGSSWIRETATEITVRFASNDRVITLPIRDAALGVTSAVDERRESAVRTTPSVARVPCRP